MTRRTDQEPVDGIRPGVDGGSVRGERGPPLVNRNTSLQSRVSTVMACGLMILLGAGILTWYYTSAISRQSRARQSAQAASASRAQGEMPLPAPTIDRPPSLVRTRQPADEDAASDTSTGSHSRTRPPQVFEKSSVMGVAPTAYPDVPTASLGEGAQYGAVQAKTPAEAALERRLSGAAFAKTSESDQSSGASSASQGNTFPGLPNGGRSDPDLAGLLRPSGMASARAQTLPTQRFLLGKGTFIDCTLETAIDSSLPGMTTCITATDTFGVDGRVVLLERGTKLIGETRGQVQQGTSRVFVVWTEARTPAGIVIPLDSPGADELGRSGLAGTAERHFWDRFGAAILISTLDGAVQAAVQSASRGSGTVIYNPSGSEGVVTDVLKSSVNIPPTVTKHNGDRIQVFVARDLDFRSVYELRATAAAR